MRMKIDDLIFYIIIFIFFVWPILKSIFKAIFSGSSTTEQQRQRSQQDIREYLERMRTTGQAKQPPKYTAPKGYGQISTTREAPRKIETTPGKPLVSISSESKFDDISNRGQFTRIEQSVKENIENSVGQHITEHVKDHLDSDLIRMEEQHEEKSAAVASKNLQDLFKSLQLTEVQKAVITADIFSKPKVLRN